MKRPAWAMASLTLLLAGCATSSAPAAVSSSPEPSSQPEISVECASIDLGTPAGDPIDLTGVWESGSMIQHVRQSGDCVWWIAYGRWPGTEPGELETLVFFGRLADDFSLHGRFSPIVAVDAATAYGMPSRGGELDLSIEFDADGNPTRLRRIGASSTESEYADELRWVGPLPRPVGPPQQ